MKIATALLVVGLLTPTASVPAHAENAAGQFTEYRVTLNLEPLDPARAGQTVTTVETFSVAGNMPLTPGQIYSQAYTFLAGDWDVNAYGALDEWEVTSWSYTADVYYEDDR